MREPIRVVHYVNQFFAQLGGEEAAFAPPEVREGPVGPGLLLQSLLGEDFQVAATLICGDNFIAQDTPGAVARLVELAAPYSPQLFVAGPAFNAGRYGPACGAICAAMGEAFSIPCVTGMYAENPGTEMYRKACYVISTRDSAAGMRRDMPKVAALAKKLALGQGLATPEEEGYFPRGYRKNVFVEKTGAERAVDMLLAKVRGEPFRTELEPPPFESIPPAPAVPDPARARIALVTEGGITDRRNSAGLESARATKFLEFDVSGLEGLPAEEFQTVHGGFNNAFANRNPNYIVPLDILRELEREGAVGEVYGKIYSTSGNGTSLKNAQAFGAEIAARLLAAHVQAVVLTST